MTDEERGALLSIALRAAYADGTRDEAERRRIEDAARALGGTGLDLEALRREALGGARSLEEDVARLATPEARSAAWEVAVGVCAADGPPGADERAFQERLRAALGLEAAEAADAARRIESVAVAPLETTPASPAGSAVPARPDGALLDEMILDAAILNGALELLPESLATMAILPLQMRLVYRVGQAHGYELDRGHVTELLGVVGVGVASQYVEQVGRKILGGILGSIGGGLLGGLGRQAASSGVAFATTYALGQVARRYYASGRTIDAAGLKQAFDSMLGDARSLAGRQADRIRERARTVDVAKLLGSVRSGDGRP